MSNSRPIVTKILKMSDVNAKALDRVVLAAQEHYRKQHPDALASDQPTVSHVLRGLIRYADELISSDPNSANCQQLVERCATAGGRWD